jgi:DNA integrity scanning protein DisA with diadenylate cyclase activity
LMAVELKNRLESALSCSLSTTLLFNYPTLETLVVYLLTEVLQIEFSAKSAPQPEATQEKAEEEVTTALEGMSKDELGALLDEKLANLEGEEQ